MPTTFRVSHETRLIPIKQTGANPVRRAQRIVATHAVAMADRTLARKTLCGRVADPEAQGDFLTASRRCPRCIELVALARTPKIQASQTGR